MINLSALRYDGARFVHHRDETFHSHTLYARHDSTLDNHYADNFYDCRILKGKCRSRTNSPVCRYISAKFNLSPWLLLVPVITGILILIKLPTIITLFISSVIAGICILIFQPHILLQIAQGETLDFTTGFKALMTSVFGSTSLSTGQPEIDALVATRGMRGMMDTIWLIICAMCFGGVMSASGMIRSITDVFVRFVRKPKSAVCSTVASGLFSTLVRPTNTCPSY